MPDPNDPMDPNFLDPNDFPLWDPKCNLETAGASEYAIDLADLTKFVEDAPWLWRACWLSEEYLMQMQSGGEMLMMLPSGGESLQAWSPDSIGMMTVSMTENAAPAQVEIQADNAIEAETEIVEVQELSIQEQIMQLQDSIAVLEQIWLDDPAIQQEITPEAWQEFMDLVYQSLDDLQTGTIQLE